MWKEKLTLIMAIMYVPGAFPSYGQNFPPPFGLEWEMTKKEVLECPFFRGVDVEDQGPKLTFRGSFSEWDWQEVDVTFDEHNYLSGVEMRRFFTNSQNHDPLEYASSMAAKIYEMSKMCMGKGTVHKEDKDEKEYSWYIIVNSWYELNVNLFLTLFFAKSKVIKEEIAIVSVHYLKK